MRAIVLTTSGATADINRAGQLGPTSFLTKPLDFRDFAQLSRTSDRIACIILLYRTPTVPMNIMGTRPELDESPDC